MTDSPTPIPAPTPLPETAPLFLADVPDGSTPSVFRQSIQNALNNLTLPEGKKAVLVQVKGSQDGTVTFGVGAKFDNGWQLEADLERRAGAPMGAEVNLVRVW